MKQFTKSILNGACLEQKLAEPIQYLEMMTHVPICHPFARPAVQGKLRCPLLLAPIAKGWSYVTHRSLRENASLPREVACEKE
ncbi:hypothetical protein KDAU_07700 [Dictyobacter aurantiacus]|uniref:Uncharacterized protein n=1 Tax=Dictyobacter aurantiacus TaxID=1936993 RepID=A0A401Z997_9CHLR|nr:hypothetical protein KDAU_07700 [Dictyobacter aurantiacus]